MYTTEEIARIAAIPDTAFKYKQQFQSLLDFYLWIKETWTATAIKQLATDNSLSLRGYENKAKFARLAAQIIIRESQPILCSSEPENEDSDPNPTNHSNQDNQTVRILAIALTLPPVPKTNGLENAPAWKILGSPIYKSELEQNFQKLLWYWHPDRSDDPTASDRISLVVSIYRRLTNFWDVKYSPLLPIHKLNQIAIEKAMQKTYDWSPESFWTDDLRSKSCHTLNSGL